MKRFLALAALVLGLASCQTEPEGLNVNVGGEVDTTITVTIPDTETRAGGNNSAVGAFDNVNWSQYTVRYIFEVYYGEGENERAVQKQVYYTDDMTASFPVRLVPGRDYNFVAWADIVAQPTDSEKMNKALPYEDTDVYYETSDLKNITIIDSNNEWKAMDETRDAYSGFHNTNGGEKYTGTSSINIQMTRPFAKLRVITTDMVELTNLDIIPTTATVTYSAFSHQSFNALNGTYSKQTIEKTHTYTIAEYKDFANNVEKKDSHKVLFTDYFFATEDQEVVNFSLDVRDQGGNPIGKTINFTTPIPAQRNYLTTIQGNILTDGNNIKVTVDDVFANAGNLEDAPYYNEVVEVNSASELKEALEAVNESTTNEQTIIVIGQDINLDDLLNAGILSTRAGEPTYGLLIPADKEVVLDLKGHTISQKKTCTASYSMILNNGNLTITGNSNGKIEFTNTAEGGGSAWGTYTIENRGEGVLTIDNVTIRHKGCVNGETNRDTNIAIQNYQGKVVINGGTIASTQFRSLRDFTAGGEIIINGGTFLGQVWMQGLGNGPSSLTINGGNFYPVDGYDGSSVYITNSSNIVNVAVNGGMFNTKIGCYDATKEGAKGCIVAGEFTTAAMENTNAALLANGYAFVKGENGTYTVENVGHYTDAEGNFHITNNKGLAWVSENVNTMEYYVNQSANIFDGKTVYLDNDIDLGGAEWRPIGDYAFSRTSFNGVFDGQGYTISNFKVTEPVRWAEKVTEASYGFFGNVKGTIKNLTIKNATVNPEGGRYSAALVGRLHNGAAIENCHVVNSSVTILHWQVGGLVSQNNNGNISNCSVVGSTITGKAAVGAIVGMDMAAGKHTIENCRVVNSALVQNESFGASYDASYGLAVGLVNASGIVLNIDNVVAEKNTIKGVADNTLVGDIETGATVTINGVSIVTTPEQLAAAIKAGGECALGADIAMTEAIYQNVDVTIDGNGHTISQAEGSTNNNALFDSVTGKITLKNIKFAGIKGGAVLRTIGAETTIENVTIEGAETTQQQGLLRLMGKSTIKNSTFKDNTCSMVITLNYDGANNDPQVVENCVFENNTCNSTAVLYYVKGAGATINGNKFLNNTVSSSGNAATLYMGFTENNTITNNLFSGNNVTTTHATSKRATGGLMIGYEATISGNAFVDNTITAEGRQLGNDVCASVYYTDIDLSGNYWGGNAPVEGDDYYKEYNNYEVIINDYLTVNPIN